ncbi:hypothetical protein [Alistipes sp.]|uniref:hypothetical protein n=1 Tax=Alistipes sp. TaxID=1872444 RepID=UPI003AEF7CD9
MEDRQLDPAQSLALIGSMIENTRSRLTRNAGHPFLAWGYATIATTLLVWAAVVGTENPRWNLLWMVLPLLGWLLTRLLRGRRPTQGVHTFVDRVLANVWLVMGLSAWFVSLVTLFTPVRIPILFLILLMMGMGTALTGLVIRFAPAVAGGAAAILLAPVSLAVPNPWAPAVFVAGFLVMMVIPGHILNYRSNRPRKE